MRHIFHRRFPISLHCYYVRFWYIYWTFRLGTPYQNFAMVYTCGIRKSSVDEIGVRYRLNHARVVKLYHPYTKYSHNVRLSHRRIERFSAHSDYFEYCIVNTLTYLLISFLLIYTVPNRATSKALRYGSHSFTCKQLHACLYLASVHQTAPPLIVVADI